MYYCWLYRQECFSRENRPLVTFIRNYIRDLSGVFSISSLVTSFLTQTVVSAQFAKCVRWILWSIWSWHKSFSEKENVNTSEDERKELQEIPATKLQQFAIKFVLGVRKKNGKYSRLYNKKKITRWLEKQYFTHSLRLFVKYCFHHSKKKFISSRPRVMSTMY